MIRHNPLSSAMRNTRCFVWVDPKDCIAPHGLDMMSPRDANKVEALFVKFQAHGFDTKYPALVGYPLNGRIQLLSGTHRHMAAFLADIKLPVTLWLRTDVERMWGTEMWPTVIKDIPVEELECHSIEDGFKVPPYEPIDMGQFSEARTKED